ncbi:MAG: DUF669 domain-containing protein [Desulfurellales bacterium]|nr:MAG: DUF669 domain-containing protein [Desulfurellales bacterium]
MAQLGMVFDPNTVPKDDLMPEGVWITMQIVASSVDPTKKGDGQILVLRMQAIDGPIPGKVHFERLNIINANATAQSIAQRALKDLCDAVGHVGVLTNSEALHGKPFQAKFKTRPADSGYAAQSQVSAYQAISGFAPHVPPQAYAAASPQPAAQAAPPAARPGGMPWGR